MIERGFATCYSGSYEHGHTATGVVIATCQILGSLLLMLSVFHEYDFYAPHYYCSARRLLDNYRNYNLIIEHFRLDATLGYHSRGLYNCATNFGKEHQSVLVEG
uniref:Uncharacterized protein n=1 Tax=Caenorhabditis japonica TaxID=281687 RepID=A0A8R1DYF3_CAEJA